MRLDPLSESFHLAVDDRHDALRLVSQYARRRGKVLEDSPSRVVFRVGSPFLFLLLGTFYARGRRSVPVKITVSVPSDRTPRLHLKMESQERGFFVRAPWLVAAFSGYFRVLYAELEEVTASKALDG